MTAILGAGGHGRDIAYDLGVSELYDDNPKLGFLPTCSFDGGRFVIGINDPRTRKVVAAALQRRGVTADGVWVHKRAVIGPDVTLGRHTHVNAGAFITRSTLGEFCTVSPNATVCGDVRVGDLVTIGAGATVCQFAVIGDGATIGAGCVIPPGTNVPPGETWVGVPGRPVR